MAINPSSPFVADRDPDVGAAWAPVDIRKADSNFSQTSGKARVVYIGGQVSTTLPDGTDKSGSIAAANTAQDVAAANPQRVGLTFQNTSDTVMRLTESGVDASATNGYQIAPGASVNVSTNKRISVFCTVAGKTFAATEY